MAKLPAWQIGLLVALLVVLQVVPLGISMAPGARVERSSMPSIAPPAPVFVVVWVVLYLLAAVALWFQCCAKGVSPGVQWTGVALLGAQLVAGWFWTLLFRSDKRAATWMVAAMLIVTLPGLVLAAKTSVTAGALWAPYAAWLVFALVLSSFSAARTSTG